MFFWILTRRVAAVAIGEAAQQYIIYTQDQQQARKKAAEKAQETGGDPSPWLDPEQTDCVELPTTEGVVFP